MIIETIMFVLCGGAVISKLAQGKDFEDWVWPINTAVWVYISIKNAGVCQ